MCRAWRCSKRITEFVMAATPLTLRTVQQIAEVPGWQLAKDDGSAYAIDPGAQATSYAVRAVAPWTVPAICLIMPPSARATAPD